MRQEHVTKRNKNSASKDRKCLVSLPSLGSMESALATMEQEMVVGNKALSEVEEQKVQCEHTSSTPPAEDSCPPPTSSDNILNSSCRSNNSSSIDSFQLGSVTSVLEDSVGGQEEGGNILLQEEEANNSILSQGDDSVFALHTATQAPLVGGNNPRITVTGPAEEPAAHSPASYVLPSPRVSQLRRSRLSTQSHNSSLESVDFDTTVEEMILYDMFGEDYDEVVKRMEPRERVALKNRIDGLSDEERRQIGERLQEKMQDDDMSPRSISNALNNINDSSSQHNLTDRLCRPADSFNPSSAHYQDGVQEIRQLPTTVCKPSIASDISPFSLSSSVEVTPNPPDSNRKYNQEEDSPPPLSPPLQTIRNNLNLEDLDESHEEKEAAILTPSAGEGEHYPKYLLPTYSALIKRCEKSPQKPVSSRPHWLPPSPSPQFPGPLTSPFRPPNTAAAGRLPTPSRGAAPSTTRAPSEFLTPASRALGVRTPGSKSRIPIARIAHGLDAGVVASPIGEYVRNNPAPHLVHNVKSRLICDLESTLVEPEPAGKAVSSFPELPCASYTAAKVAQDVEYDTLGKDFQIHKAFGQTQTLVKVTRHVERTKMAPGGISWDDAQLVNTDSSQSSPSQALKKGPVKSLLKRTQRDSGLFDESMLEVSLHQTQVVKKIAGQGKVNKAKKKPKK